MYPRYLNLTKKELEEKIEKLFKNLKNCRICPRRCRVNRLRKRTGFCQLGEKPVVSAFHPHFGEESVLVGPSAGASTEPCGELRTEPLSRTSSGQGGSGTIFFTSCNLACVFCQNYEISQMRIGEEISFERLAQMMIDLQNKGCHNINLVSPTSQASAIIRALSIAIEKGLKIPLVYNTNSYDLVETLKLLEGIVDIYMPDAKYSDDKNAKKYSNVLYPALVGRDGVGYFEIMKKSIKEMHRQVGDLVINEKGVAIQGLLVRHLVLPNDLAGSEKIFEFISKEISKNTFLNIMDQYYPCFKAFQYPELSRRITRKEYQEAIKTAKEIGLKRIYLG